MIPFGPVYRELRGLMLDVLPADMTAASSDGVNFSQWIEQGAYFVSRHNNKGVFLSVSPHDLGTALVRDVEYLIDSCFEQMLEILSLVTPSTRSPSWGVVTCYYYAFFAAQALSRIIGKPVTYLDDSRVSMIKKIYSTPISLGAGSFAVSKIQDLSATQTEFALEKSKLRPHDAVWKQVFQLLSDLKLAHKPGPRSTDLAATQEFQMLDALTSTKPFKAFLNGGFNWPCEVRYEANYRVGNAYKMLRKPWQLQPHPSMKGWRGVTIESMINTLGKSLAGFEPDDSTEGLKARARFMLDAGNTILAIVRRLQADLVDRRKTDARWEDRRVRFFKKHESIFDGMDSWLFPSS